MKPSEPTPTLPPDAGSLIARTVKRARLRAAERDDVTRELRSHFAEALADGAPIEDVVGGFGDPDAAGRLIGRAKRRCRSITWHAWVWSCRSVAALFALVLITYAWAAWAYYGAEPTITRNYVKEMNDRIEAIPEDDRAWPLYKRALLSIPKADVDRIFDLSTGAVEGTEEWRELRELVLKHRGAIDVAIAGSRRSTLGYIARAQSDAELAAWGGDEHAALEVGEAGEIPLWRVPIPSGQSGRHISFLLRAEAKVAIADGDAERWQQAVLAGLRLGEQMQEFPSLIAYLTSLSIKAMFSRYVAAVVAQHPERLTNDALVAVAHALADAERWTNTISLESERIMLNDMLQRTYGGTTGMITAAGIDSMKASFGGPDQVEGMNGFVLSPPPLLGPVTAGMMAPRDTVLAKGFEALNEFEHRARQLAYQRTPNEFAKWIQESKSSMFSHLRWWPLHVMLPAVSGTILARDQHVMHSRGLRAAIAVELFRREKGALPASLDELVPRFLPAVPIDTYSGVPIRYTLRDGVPIVYSVGSDMNDDMGRMPPSRDGGHAWYNASGPTRLERPDLWDDERERSHDGDWILWPPVDEQTGAFIFTPRTD